MPDSLNDYLNATPKHEGVQMVRRNADGTEQVVTRPGEPFFLIRAHDPYAPAAVAAYAGLLEAAAATLDAAPAPVVEVAEEEHRELVERLLHSVNEVSRLADRIRDWQQAQPDTIKIPD